MPWESRSSFPDSLLADHMHGQNIADCYAAAQTHLRYCFINNDAVRGGTDGGAGGWGALGSGWDAVGFDAALEAPPRDDERLRLIGDLIDALPS